MIVGVPKELFPGERRVALTPIVVPLLIKLGLEVLVEAGAGIEAGFPDSDFEARGAKIAVSDTGPPCGWIPIGTARTGSPSWRGEA